MGNILFGDCGQHPDEEQRDPAFLSEELLLRILSFLVHDDAAACHASDTASDEGFRNCHRGYGGIMSVTEAARILCPLESVSREWKRFIDTAFANLVGPLEMDSVFLERNSNPTNQCVSWLSKRNLRISSLRWHGETTWFGVNTPTNTENQATSSMEWLVRGNSANLKSVEFCLAPSALNSMGLGHHLAFQEILAEDCPQLEHLHFRLRLSSADLGHKPSYRQYLCPLLFSHQYLQSLELNMFTYYFSPIDEDCIAELTQNLPSLRHLALTMMGSPTDWTIYNIKSQSLRTLEIDSIHPFRVQCPSLEAVRKAFFHRTFPTRRAMAEGIRGTFPGLAVPPSCVFCIQQSRSMLSWDNLVHVGTISAEEVHSRIPDEDAWRGVYLLHP